jgi:hypothetical protein
MPLVKNNVESIAQNPFGWQQDYNSPEFTLVTDGRILRGERDEGIEITTQMARKHGIEALSIGAELHATVKLRPDAWRKVIAAVRQVYRDQLTYCANWYQEFEDVKFWDELDFIGIQAYFPLCEKEKPPIDELKKGWQAHMEAIEKIRRQYRKPVVFTEIGYRSTPDAAIKPWE